MAKLKLQTKHDPALVVERRTAAPQCAVYLLVANKNIKYTKTSSRIVYIGKTDRGMERVHESAAEKATQVFRTASNPSGIHGVTRLSAYTITFDVPAQWGEKWAPSILLERACLIAFKDLFGQPPHANDQRNAMRDTIEFNFFNRQSIEKQLKKFP